MQAPITRLRVGDVSGDSEEEIVVFLDDGRVLIYDGPSRMQIAEFQSGVDSGGALLLSDLDSNGKKELILCTNEFDPLDNLLRIYNGQGVLQWELADVGGSDLVVGNFDDDSALEIITARGEIVDTSTQNVESYSIPQSFRRVAADDIDGDGKDELIGAEFWTWIWAYNIDSNPLPLWSYNNFNTDSIFVADPDGDGVNELLVGDAQHGDVFSLNMQTLTIETVVNKSQHGTQHINLADIDRDGEDEIIFGCGHSSTGPDRIVLADASSGVVEWESIQLDGPFIGPVLGDLDGDGKK